MSSGSKKHFEPIEEINLLKARIRELEDALADSALGERGGEDDSSFLSAVLDNIGEAIIICDKEGRIIRFNQAARRLHGLGEKPIPPDKWSEHYDLYKTDGLTTLPTEEIPLYRALKGEHVNNAEIVVAPKNKDARFLVCNGQALIDEKGKIMGAVVAMHDSTKQKKAFERLSAVMDNLPIGIAINTVDPKVDFIYMNDNFWKNYRTTKEALQEPDRFWDVVYEDPVFREEIKTLVEGDCAAGDPEKMYWQDVPITRSGEGSFYVCAMNIPVQGMDLMISTVWDVTDRKRAEEALRESEEKHRRLFETMAQGVIYQSPDGSIISANPAAEEILGLSFERMQGRTSNDPRWAMILEDGSPVPGDEHPSMAALKTGKKIGPATRGVFNEERKAYVWLSITAIPLFEEGGSVPFQVYATFSDVTEQKSAEDEREKLQVQLAQAQRLESVGRLAGGVAHDFNNMLGIILGHAELAMKVTDPSHSTHMDLFEITTAVHRSADLVKQLLAFARRQTIDPKFLDLNESIEKILKMLRRLIGEDIDLSWLPSKKLWPVKLDPSQLDQILANLFVNARDAISGVGKVTIETGNVPLDDNYAADRPGFVPGDYVMIAVSDNGTGIDKEILGDIFDPFFTTKEVGEGTGLGLATVYGIVKQNNGYINVYSKKGRGTTFKIYIPRHIGEVEKEPAQNRIKHVSGGGETVLVVEDEQTLLPVVETLLRRSGYKVLSAGSPGEALEIAENCEGKIDLLLTDVVMPGMNGRDLAARLKSVYSDLKVLFMSGYTSNIIVHHRILDKEVCFVQKPFSMNELALKVRETLDDESN